MSTRKPRVITSPVADHYALDGEKIIEYSYPDADPVLNVTLYRHGPVDGKVRVHVSKKGS